MQGQTNAQNPGPFVGQNSGQNPPPNNVYGTQSEPVIPKPSANPQIPNSSSNPESYNRQSIYSDYNLNPNQSNQFNQPTYGLHPANISNQTPTSNNYESNFNQTDIVQPNLAAPTNIHPATLQELKKETNQTPVSNSNQENTKLKTILKSVAVLVIVIILLAAMAVVIVLTLPNSAPSKWLKNNTFLSSLNSKNQTTSALNTSVQKTSSSSLPSTNIDEFAFQPATGNKPVIQVIEDSLPAVLSISLKSRGDNINLVQDLSSGSGYIVSSDGLVVTNKHVVAIICKNDAERIQITGLTYDQKAYNLTLKSIDPVDDIAILQIDSNGEKFPTISFGNSDNLKLGQDVVAIGNVLGELQNTVTKGIVSGLNRSFETEITDQCTGLDFQADNLIQTDAAINRGNSGGPLFNSSGQLIGMNTLGTVDAQNIGLAIPSSTIRNILDGYVNNNLIVRARLGLSSLQINSIRKAQNTWIPTDYGELVFRQEGSPVDSNSAAGEAGIKEGDIILEFNGKKLVSTNNNPSPIRREVLNSQAGQKIQLTILKARSKTQTGFTYEQNPVTIDVILGSTNFDLKTKEVVAN